MQIDKKYKKVRPSDKEEIMTCTKTISKKEE